MRFMACRRKNGQKNVWQRLNEAFSGFQDNNSKPAAQSDRILISEVSTCAIQFKSASSGLLNIASSSLYLKRLKVKVRLAQLMVVYIQ